MCARKERAQKRRGKRDRKVRKSVYQSNNEVSAQGQQSGTPFWVDFILQPRMPNCTDPQTIHKHTVYQHTYTLYYIYTYVHEKENQVCFNALMFSFHLISTVISLKSAAAFHSAKSDHLRFMVNSVTLFLKHSHCYLLMPRLKNAQWRKSSRK